MNKNAKRLAAVGLILTMALGLTACGNIGDVMSGALGGGKIDSTTYIQGQLDEYYKGTASEEYMKMVETTTAEVQQTHEQKLKDEADFFISNFQIEYPTEETHERLEAAYGKIYAMADYTVVSGAKQDDESYSVKVTVRPLDTMQIFMTAVPDALTEFEAQFTDVDTEAMSDEEFDEWYQNVYDVAYQETLLDVLESKIAETGKLEEKNIAVQIEKDPEDGLYVIDSESFGNLDLLIIDYSDPT